MNPPVAAEQQKLTVRPFTSSTGFVYPSLYSFPPFFTKQPNEQTWSHQRSQWIRLILAHSRYHKVHTLALSEETCSASELFHNRSISRQLQLPTLRLVVAAMVAAGQAEYDPRPTKGAQPTGALVYWKKPDEWAQLIYDWVKENGLTGSIMTLYELTEGGDLVHTTEFYQLPDPILRRALTILEKQGKCSVFRVGGDGEGEEGDGVKFV